MYFILIQPLEFFFFQSKLLGFNKKSKIYVMGFYNDKTTRSR